MEKTNNYDMFIFRNDNREEINQSHVCRLAESISSRNLLHMRPIIVNSAMEVIDGQHRLLAAKQLEVSIYYKVEPELNITDMLAMNCQKSWGIQDYVNYFVKNGYQEYIKLQEFAKKNNICIRTAYSLTMSNKHKTHSDFRKGKYVFNTDMLTTEIDFIWRCIDYIRKLNGNKNTVWTTSTKFWNAMIKLVKSANFDENKFFDNMKKMIEKISIRATHDGYCKMLQEINNWRNQNRVSLLEEDYS